MRVMETYSTSKEQIIKQSVIGQIPFIISTNTRNCQYLPLITQGYFCVTDAEVAAAKAASTGAQRIVYSLHTNKVNISEDSGSTWTIPSNRTVFGDLGPGRLLYNNLTRKLFYLEANNEYYHLNGAAW